MLLFGEVGRDAFEDVDDEMSWSGVEERVDDSVEEIIGDVEVESMVAIWLLLFEQHSSFFLIIGVKREFLDVSKWLV
jgi:hypothetical protein